MNIKKILTAIAMGSVASSASAAIYTISDFSHNSNTATHFDFGTDWSGAPAIDNLTGESSLYLAFTVSWQSSSDPGDFYVQYALDDGGGRGRADASFFGGNPGNRTVEVYRANGDSDGDGAGPATVRPEFPLDTTTTTSATFVLKVDQLLGSPGGDWNYGTIGEQSEANAFLYVNPNLSTTEANNSTVLAGWRSGQNQGYDSVTFNTSNLAAGNAFSFSNIALYTGEDTPFNAIPEPSSVVLIGLAGFGLIARRRR